VTVLDAVHGGYVHRRRVRVLSDVLVDLVPRDARVVDVGAGDGLLARTIADRRPDLDVSGVDVLVRPETAIPVQSFDGQRLPLADKSVDAVLFVDVLHHTIDPLVLLREAKRVSRQVVLIKDHLADGWLARPTLRFMDHVGNARHGVALPHTYLRREEWQRAFDAVGLTIEVWRGQLSLYPPVASMVFDRSLHFVARLR
jgi:SAM-dependent methyltransferase